MTISMAWLRKSGGTQELIFASDSRLSGGGHVDQCQKVFGLPREDCCIAFAGSTSIAYPFILQLQNVIEHHTKSLDRQVDIKDVKTRAVSLLNFFIRVHEGTIADVFASELLETSFIFGGWSWRAARFYVWKIVYKPALKRYIAIRAGNTKTASADQGVIALVGDYLPQFHKALKRDLAGAAAIAAKTYAALNLDFQPLRVLAKMLADPKFTDRRSDLSGKIGGAPQVTAIYPFLRTKDFAVEWDIEDKFVYSIKGRVIADFELFENPAIDPFTGEFRTPVRGSRGNEIEAPGMMSGVSADIGWSSWPMGITPLDLGKKT